MADRFCGTLKGSHCRNVEKNKTTLLDVLSQCQRIQSCTERNRGRFIDGVPVRACGDCRESQRSEAMFVGNPDRLLVTTRQPLTLAVIAIAKDRSNRMDDVFRAKLAAARDHGISRRQSPDSAADRPAFF